MEAKLKPTTEASDKFINKIGNALCFALYALCAALSLSALIWVIRWW
jgi:hypothetical protein